MITLFFKPALLFTLITALVSSTTAQVPDLTSGGQPGDNNGSTITTNLGPTGMRGWVYHDKTDSSLSRQILVTEVDPGTYYKGPSPAAVDGIIAVDDVILGADGTGAEPSDFSSDARKSFADAIADAEARSPAELKLIRWRAGVTTTVTLTLETLGAYSATAPYNCPKSARILKDHAVYGGQDTGKFFISALAALACYDPDNPDPDYPNSSLIYRAGYLARKHIPADWEIPYLLDDNPDTTNMVTWERGHALIVLAEYYLATGDASFLPAIEAHAVNIAKSSSLFGTTGHKFADKNLDGSLNGPMGGVYGTVNSAGMPCFLGLLLARECGLTHVGFQPDTAQIVEAAIARSSRFFAYYAHKGGIPYGEHGPGQSGHENNGKSGLAALCFALQDNRIDESQFYAKMATASGSERENGHTGAYFNYLWAPLGAAVAGEEAAAAYFARTSWHYDLARLWDGGFVYDCLNGQGPNSGESNGTWNDFRANTAMLLTYALPLRRLHITGRGHETNNWLTSNGVTEAVFADDYGPTTRSTDELVSDLGFWSPKVQLQAATELATRTSETTALLPTLHALANDPNGSSRAGACQALGFIGHADSAPVLAALLTDPDNLVRLRAADAMRYLPRSAALAEINTILAATASTAKPLLPLVEEDPMQYTHGALGTLLFFSGGGSKGVIWDDLTGIDRDLLYPAIRAVAATPNGRARNSLQTAYQKLTPEDVNALAGTIVDSVYYRAPADKMFSGGVRLGGLIALQANNIAEGVPLCRIYPEEDSRNSVIPAVLDVLEAYAGGVNTVSPDPQIISYLQGIVDNIDRRQNPHDVRAQEVMDIIAADTDPIQPTAFKSIQSVTADAAALQLPANQTVLHVAATDLAEGDSIYTWRKVYGAGNVTFSPNGSGESKDTTITFDNVSGRYIIEVTMSDSRGLTEVYETIDINLANTDGTLPADSTPPSPATMTWATPPNTSLDNEITMTATTATDPSGVEYFFDETSGKPGGTDSGWQDSPSYTDTGLSPETTYTYTVQARDKSTNQNLTVVSAPASATTAAADILAPIPNPMTFAFAPRATGSTSISMTAATATDVSGVEYYFTETSDNPGGSDSGWQDSPSYTDTGLNGETPYSYTVTARDKSSRQNATDPSSAIADRTQWTPPTSGSILSPGTDVSFGDNGICHLSVHPGTEGAHGYKYDGITSVSVNFGKVIDYKLFIENGTSNMIASYGDGGGTADPADSRVSEVTTTDTGISNISRWDVWTTATYGVDKADFTGNTAVNNINGITSGTVDISGMSAGIVYFFYGSYLQRSANLTATMSDNEGVATPITTPSFGGSFEIAGDTEYMITPLRFTNDAGYDRISYDLTQSGGGKFIGVIVSDLSPISGNTPPTISTIADQSVSAGGSTEAIAFTVGDAETAAGSLTVTASSSDTTLIPENNIVISGSDGNRTVTTTPATGLTGSAIITITVDDGTESTNETFLLTVTGTYQIWAAEAGMTSDPNADSNSNGLPDLLEYALASGSERGELNDNTLTFSKRGAPYGSDLTYVIEVSSDLGVNDPWTTAVSGVIEDTSSVSYTFTPGNPPHEFARLKVIVTP